MASRKIVLAELGNVVVEASKKCKDAMTLKQARKEWLEVLEKSSKAYAVVAKSEVVKTPK